MSFSDNFGEKLTEVLMESATDQDRAELSAMVEEFKTKFGYSYNRLMQQPFARSVILALDEAVRFHADMRADK